MIHQVSDVATRTTFGAFGLTVATWIVDGIPTVLNLTAVAVTILVGVATLMVKWQEWKMNDIKIRRTRKVGSAMKRHE